MFPPLTLPRSCPASFEGPSNRIGLRSSVVPREEIFELCASGVRGPRKCEKLQLSLLTIRGENVDSLGRSMGSKMFDYHLSLDVNKFVVHSSKLGHCFYWRYVMIGDYLGILYSNRSVMSA